MEKLVKPIAGGMGRRVTEGASDTSSVQQLEKVCEAGHKYGGFGDALVLFKGGQGQKVPWTPEVSEI